MGCFLTRRPARALSSARPPSWRSAHSARRCFGVSHWGDAQCKHDRADHRRQQDKRRHLKENHIFRVEHLPQRRVLVTWASIGDAAAARPKAPMSSRRDEAKLPSTTGRRRGAGSISGSPASTRRNPRRASSRRKETAPPRRDIDDDEYHRQELAPCNRKRPRRCRKRG